MARGVWAQAVSDTGDLNFNIYLYNVEPGVAFDYNSGQSSLDPQMKVKDN